MSNIVVIGSSNTDMVVKTSHLPVGGETVLGGDFFMNAGGKGANQAVAAATNLCTKCPLNCLLPLEIVTNM